MSIMCANKAEFVLHFPVLHFQRTRRGLETIGPDSEATLELLWQLPVKTKPEYEHADIKNNPVEFQPDRIWNDGA